MAARKLLLSGMAARKLLLFGMLAAGCFASQARVITGQVLSESDSTAIVGAVCRLSVDSAVIVSSVTDDKGSFRLATAKDEKHQAIVSVEMIGYAPAEIVIPSNDHDLNIGTVYLSEGIALGEVEVTHQTFTDSRGRTIVYPSPSEVKASPTAVSLFQKLPLAGLEANPINRSISVDGGSPVILINGVPSTLSNFNALHPKDIERVEYSRFTPARYADKGNSGYLNIILKKRTDGGSIFAWLRDCPFTGFLDGQLQSSYHQGPSQFTLRYDGSWRHFIRNLSSAQVNWNVSDRWSLYGNFSYRPSIPGLSSLTDYPQQTTPYIISNGNPDLKVAEYVNYAVGTNFNYKKIRGGLGAQYFRINNPWQSYVRYLGDRMFMNQSLNFDHQQNFLLSANINIPDFHGFGFNGKIFLEHDSSRGAGWSEELTSLSGSINLWWSKGPFTISYYRKFPGKNLYGTRVSKEENSDMLQFQYRPDKHWTLAASWMYMFETAGTKYYRWDYSPANPGTSYRHISSNANMAVFTVSYSADFGSIFRTGRRGLHNSDNGSSLLKL